MYKKPQSLSARAQTTPGTVPSRDQAPRYGRTVVTEFILYVIVFHFQTEFSFRLYPPGSSFPPTGTENASQDFFFFVLQYLLTGR
jgi:hypothetical protein